MLVGISDIVSSLKVPKVVGATTRRAIRPLRAARVTGSVQFVPLQRAREEKLSQTVMLVNSDLPFESTQNTPELSPKEPSSEFK